MLSAGDDGAELDQVDDPLERHRARAEAERRECAAIAAGLVVAFVAWWLASLVAC